MLEKIYWDKLLETTAVKGEAGVGAEGKDVIGTEASGDLLKVQSWAVPELSSLKVNELRLSILTLTSY